MLIPTLILTLSTALTVNGFESPEYEIGMLNEQTATSIDWNISESYVEDQSPFRIESVDGNRVLRIDNRYGPSDRMSCKVKLYPSKKVICSFRIKKAQGWHLAADHVKLTATVTYDRYTAKINIHELSSDVWHDIRCEFDNSAGYKLKVFINDTLIKEEYARVYSGRNFSFSLEARKQIDNKWFNIFSYMDDWNVEIE